jgi:3-dehydroquinate synthetase
MPVSLLERRLEIDSSVRQGQSQVAFPVHLPTELPVDSFGVNAVLDRMQFDKNAIGGKLRFVLPASLGHV